MLNIKKASLGITIGLLTSNYVIADPSGLKSVPADVIVPKETPVELLADSENANLIHVKPLTGIITTKAAVKSPLTNCEAVESELRGAEATVEVRNRLYIKLKEFQAAYDEILKQRSELVPSLEAIKAEVKIRDDQKTRLESQKTEVMQELAALATRIKEARELISISTDANQIAALEQSIKDAERESTPLKAEFVRLNREIRKANEEREAYFAQQRRVEAQLAPINDQADSIGDSISKVITQITPLEAMTEASIKKYSERNGGYVTFTAEFAPSRYLRELEAANPEKYDFRYVRNHWARIDVAVPTRLRQASALETRIGGLIHSVKAQDGTNYHSSQPVNAANAEASLKEGPHTTAENNAREAISSLTGSKFLQLELSTLGFCAVVEPTALKSQFQNNAAEVFKIALFYDYPMYFDLHIEGRYNSYAMMYDFFKQSSSSSWFGLKKSQKIETMRKYQSSDFMQINVKPRGVPLSLQESQTLADKMREQLVYTAAKNFLDIRSLPQQTPPTMDNRQPGAELSKLGGMISRIPSPWTFWTGNVLSLLGGMFGSKSVTVIQETKASSWVNINTTTGFVMLMPADLTVTDFEGVQPTIAR